MNYVISVCIQKDIVYHGPLYHVTSLFHEHMEICPETRSQEYNYTPHFDDRKYTMLQKFNSQVSGLNYATAENWTILGWLKTSNKLMRIGPCTILIFE